MDLFMNVALIYLVLMAIGTGFMYELHFSEPAIFRKLYFCNQQKNSAFAAFYHWRRCACKNYRIR